MLHQLYNFPRSKHFILACSGGVDSMAIADFFVKGGKNFSVAYFNHMTPYGYCMQDTVRNWAKKNNVPALFGELNGQKRPDQSPEEFWRIERYKWLCSQSTDIVTCHHLNDAVEGYLFSCLHGNPKIINSCVTQYYGASNGGSIIYRPFLTNTKQQLIDWCKRHDVEWFEDQSNVDVRYPRNRIRHNIMPEALKVNPGLLKVIKKKIITAAKASASQYLAS